MNDRDPGYSAPKDPSMSEVVNWIYRKHDRILPKRELGRGVVFSAGETLAGGLDDNGDGEALDNIIVVGNMSLGLSRTYDGEKPTSVRLFMLPLEQGQSFATITEVNLAAMREPQANGVVQEWRDITVGRSDVYRVSGVVDNQVSRAHFTMRVMADGRVELSDSTSKNGTVVVKGSDMSRDEKFGGLPLDARQQLAESIKPLFENPSLWQRNGSETDQNSGENQGRFGRGVVIVDHPGPLAIRQASVQPGSGVQAHGNGIYSQHN